MREISSARLKITFQTELEDFLMKDRMSETLQSVIEEFGMEESIKLKGTLIESYQENPRFHGIVIDRLFNDLKIKLEKKFHKYLKFNLKNNNEAVLKSTLIVLSIEDFSRVLGEFAVKLNESNGGARDAH
jgi:hypothetical protein